MKTSSYATRWFAHGSVPKARQENIPQRGSTSTIVDRDTPSWCSCSSRPWAPTMADIFVSYAKTDHAAVSAVLMLAFFIVITIGAISEQTRYDFEPLPLALPLVAIVVIWSSPLILLS